MSVSSENGTLSGRAAAILMARKVSLASGGGIVTARKRVSENN
jgi:hypothetical protein